jgi:hypothetical protein
MTINIRAIACDNADDALGWADASGYGEVILLDGEYLVVKQAEADRLAEAGVEFAYLIDHEMPDGSFRMMTIPVND